VTTAAAKAVVNGGAFPAAALVAGDEGALTIGDGNKAASVNLVVGDTVDTIVGKVNARSRTPGSPTSSRPTTAGALDFTATDFTTDITIGGTAATLTATGQTAGTTSNTDAVATYVDTDGNTVSVTGNGNQLALTGELSGLTLTIDGAANAVGTIAATKNEGFTFQIGANQNQTATVDFQRVTADAIGNVGANFLADADVSTATNAQTALGLIDKALSDVGNFRGKLGAFQANTLESTANNLRTTLENTVAAESVIRDTDFASEIANFTKFQTMMQAGSTVLGNANQMTQLVAGPPPGLTPGRPARTARGRTPPGGPVRKSRPPGFDTEPPLPHPRPDYVPGVPWRPSAGSTATASTSPAWRPASTPRRSSTASRPSTPTG
jgi:flagellin